MPQKRNLHSGRGAADRHAVAGDDDEPSRIDPLRQKNGGVDADVVHLNHVDVVVGIEFLHQFCKTDGVFRVHENRQA